MTDAESYLRNMKDREQECFIALQKTLAVVVIVWIYAEAVMLNYRHGLRQEARIRNENDNTCL